MFYSEFRKRQRKYFCEVDKYYAENKEKVYKCILSGVKSNRISFEDVEKILESYPKIWKYPSENSKKQIMSFFDHLNYKLNYELENISFALANEIYSSKVTDYIAKNGKGIIYSIVNLCSENKDRLEYSMLEEKLRQFSEYPEYPAIPRENNELEIILFLNQLGFIFSFDEKSLYFI